MDTHSNQSTIDDRSRARSDLMHKLSSHLAVINEKHNVHTRRKEKDHVFVTAPKCQNSTFVSFVHTLKLRHETCKLQFDILYFYQLHKREQTTSQLERQLARLYEVLTQCEAKMTILQRKLCLLFSPSPSKTNQRKSRDTQKQLLSVEEHNKHCSNFFFSGDCHHEQLYETCTRLISQFLVGINHEFSLKQFRNFVLDSPNAKPHWRSYFLHCNTVRTMISSMSSTEKEKRLMRKRVKHSAQLIRDWIVTNVELYFDEIVKFERLNPSLNSGDTTVDNVGQSSDKVGFSHFIEKLTSPARQQQAENVGDSSVQEVKNEENIEQKRLLISRQLSPQLVLQLYHFICEQTLEKKQLSAQLRTMQSEHIVHGLSEEVDLLMRDEKKMESFLKQYAKDLYHTCQTISQHLSRLSNMSNEAWIRVTRDPNSLLSMAQSLESEIESMVDS